MPAQVFDVRAVMVAVPTREQQSTLRVARRIEKLGWKVQSFSFTGLLGYSAAPPGRKFRALFRVYKEGGTAQSASAAVQQAGKFEGIKPVNLADWVVFASGMAQSAPGTSADAGEDLLCILTGQCGPDSPECEVFGVKCNTLVVVAGLIAGAVIVTNIAGFIPRFRRSR